MKQRLVSERSGDARGAPCPDAGTGQGPPEPALLSAPRPCTQPTSSLAHRAPSPWNSLMCGWLAVELGDYLLLQPDSGYWVTQALGPVPFLVFLCIVLNRIDIPWFLVSNFYLQYRPCCCAHDESTSCFLIFPLFLEVSQCPLLSICLGLELMPPSASLPSHTQMPSPSVLPQNICASPAVSSIQAAAFLPPHNSQTASVAHHYCLRCS